MAYERFKNGKDIIAAGWPADKIILNTDDKIIVKCENDSYLVFRFFKPVGDPVIDAVVANKMAFQFTLDLNTSFTNINSYIYKSAISDHPQINEAICELSARVQIGNVLI